MDYRILNVSVHDAQLCVGVEYFNADASHWFFEEYHWQGREGLKRPRLGDGQGRGLLDDGNVAPLRLQRSGNPNDPGDYEEFLPPGREWAYGPAPHMDEGSVLIEIENAHRRGRLQGYDGRQPNAKLTHSSRDSQGVGILLAKFAPLVGRQGTIS